MLFFVSLPLYIFNKSAYSFYLTCLKKNLGIESDNISSFLFYSYVLQIQCSPMVWFYPIFFRNSRRNRDLKHAAEMTDKLARAARKLKFKASRMYTFEVKHNL